MSQLQVAGGQPQKQPKYAALYSSKVFNGLVTNRSPLRGVLPSLYEQFYKMSYGDVMIAGANVEVSNRLTLVRRPGNPIFDSNTWGDIQSFDEFPVNKAASDTFGTVLEDIFTMVSEPGALYATNDGVKQLVFADAAAQGQTYMQPIGNSLYFSNGIDNKKWFQSLLSWAANFNLQGADGNAGTYAFFQTYMLTGSVSASANTQQIQQFIAVAVANITEVQVADGVLTLTINDSGIPNAAGAVFPLDSTAPSFQIWGVNTATWLNGALITPLEVVTIGTTTTVTANFMAPTADAAYGPASDTGYLTQIGTTPVVAITGASQPTWPTSITAVANTSDDWGATAPTGNIILDGNCIWVCRGGTVQNWGIEAPDTAPTTSDVNSTTSGWRMSTYYSAPGIIVSSSNIWQVTTAGTTGASNTFPASPSVGQTHTDGGVTWTCVANASTVTWAASTAYKEGVYAGAYPWTGSVTIDGTTYAAGQFIPDWKSGSFVIATAAGTPCVFMLQRNIPSNSINVPISATYGGGAAGHAGWSAAFFSGANRVTGIGYGDLTFGSPGTPVLFGTSTPESPALTVNGLSSLMWNFYPSVSSPNYDQLPMILNTVTPAGQMSAASYTTPWSGMSAPYQICQWGKVRIPVPGMNVTFTIVNSNALWFGIDSSAGAAFVSYAAAGVTPGLTNLGKLGAGQTTPMQGYTPIAGWNGANDGNTTTVVINFPNAGVFGIEFVMANIDNGNHNDYMVSANGSLIVPENSSTGTSVSQALFESCTTSPVFGSQPFTTTPAAQNTYPAAPEISNNAAGGNSDGFASNQGQELVWYNLGPVTDFAWPANTPVTVPSAIVIDSNSNEERAYESGVSGVTQPTWNSSEYGITQDTLVGGTLQWINEGAIPAQNNTPGSITATSDQGWLYWIALGNSLDQTVSNLSPVSKATGPIVAGNITLPAGSGIDVATLDPQVDFVLIFRTVDNGALPLLVPGLGNSIWSVPLTQYLQNGYIDTTADTDLDDEIEGADAGENTPPPAGTVNLSYHLSRGWYSVGNNVFYTSGPTAPVGNGNGTNPLNYDTLPSRVVRLTPTAIGMLVFTVSDIYIIAGNGTSTNPILPAVPYEPGIGLANYNALDVNGALIGFFTTDKQFLIFDPSAGLNYAGFPIGDQFRLNNGTPGQSWNTSSVYVAWYANGEDQAWFVGDGQFGWYKLIDRPAPEVGFAWSPFATVAGQAISAIASIETSPGVHNLLVGPASSGNILARNLDASTDAGSGNTNGATYPAYGVFGSFVLALPGQVAKVAFITLKSVRVGSPAVLGVLIDEALPYYKGSFDFIKRWVTDPPELPPSRSFYKQRFYLSENPDETAYCSDLQFMVQWPAEAAPNELQTFSVWGAFEVEA